MWEKAEDQKVLKSPNDKAKCTDMCHSIPMGAEATRPKLPNNVPCTPPDNSMHRLKLDQGKQKEKKEQV